MKDKQTYRPGDGWKPLAARGSGVYPLGQSPCADYLAVAEGDAARPDFLGGVVLYDVTALSEPPPVLATYPTAGVGPDGYWTTISNAVSSMTFAYTPFRAAFDDASTATDPLGSGLLRTVTDPNGGTWTYTYNGRGQLQQDQDAGNGHVGVSRVASQIPLPPDTEVAQAYQLDHATAGGKHFRHDVVNFKDGSAKRRIETPDGTATIDIARDLSETGTLPWGTFSRTRQPGQTVGLTSDLPFRLGHDAHANLAVTRSDPLDLLSVTGFTQASRWNGAQSTSSGSGSTITSTTPGGRTITTATDAMGRPTTITLPGLPALSIAYDHGRPTSVTQGSRSVSLGYQGGFLSHITDPLGRAVSLTRDSGGRVRQADVFGQQQFGFDYDPNGNVTKATSPQSAGYEEPFGYSPVDLLQSFRRPHGETTISYTPDREGAGGTSPHGALAEETYTRDAGGRIRTKTTQIRNPAAGALDSVTAA